MTATNYARNQIQDQMFGAVNIVVPASYFIGLSTTTISLSGSNASEPGAAEGYARVEVANNKTNFRYATAGCILNATAITWAESSGSWGTVTTVFAADALTSGSIWFYTTLPSSKVIQADTIVSFAASALAFTLT